MQNQQIKLNHDTVDKEDINALIEWLSQSELPQLTKGPVTGQLESRWAEKLGSKYSLFVQSGSSAILLTLAALQHIPGRLKNNRIIVPALSWATDVSTPMLLGYDTYMCDCNLTDLSCDLDHLEQLFKAHAPAVLLLVSPLGFIPDMDRILKLCEEYQVELIEDACESMWSSYNNKRLGTFGAAGLFSLYFGHHVSTIEGGLINTDDKQLYEYMTMIRSHGWDRDLPEATQQSLRSAHDLKDFESMFKFYVPGMNLRSTDLQAFLGLRAIDKIEPYSTIRNQNLTYYCESISNNMLSITNSTEHFNSNFAYPYLHEARDSIAAELKQNNIDCRPLIAGNMARNPMWTGSTDNLPNADTINDYGMYLPNHQCMTRDDILQIADIVNKY